jgi:hypothetical protein
MFPASLYQTVADLLALPIALIINECYKKSIFPDCLKTALVTPLFKKGDKTDPCNYRPISSLPIISKVFELDMKNQIMTFIETHGILSDRQFGFRKHHSSEQLLLSLLQNWRTTLDNPQPNFIGALSLDVRKAFDTINHGQLIHTLKRLNFAESTTKLFTSYLSHRTQIMKVDHDQSSALPITCGVPQGSVLGPILFNLAINDLLNKHKTAFAYADDTVIYCTATDIPTLMDKSESLMREVSNWYSNNLLQLNLSKTQYCIFSNRKVEDFYQIQINNLKIESKHSLNLLGVILDSELSLTPQANATASKANKMVYLLSKLKKYMTVENSLKTYKSLIRPIVEYCSSLYLDGLAKNSDTLEKVQNKAIRIITSAPKQFSVTSGRLLLNLHTLHSRRNFLFHNFVKSRVHKGRASKHILHLVSKSNRHTRSLRSNCAIIKPSFRSNLGKSAFLNIFHTFVTKSTKPHESLSFNPT